MATKTYSSIHPQTRIKIEQMIENIVDEHGPLTLSSIEAYSKEYQGRPGIPLNHHRLREMCASLRRKGVLIKVGRIKKRAIWAVKQYWE